MRQELLRGFTGLKARKWILEQFSALPLLTTDQDFGGAEQVAPLELWKSAAQQVGSGGRI